MDNKKQYIYGLDGLRAVSMLMVMMFHFTSYLLPELTGTGKYLGGFFSVGWAGVDVFLVISGYLISEILNKRSVSNFSDFNLFILGRLKRLFAPYLIVVIVISFASFFTLGSDKLLGNTWTLWTLFSNVFSSFYDRGGLSNNYFALFHLWSIALEIHFYVIFSVAFIFIRNRTAFSIAMIAIAMLFRVVLGHFYALDNAVYSFTFCRIDAFAIGVLVSVIKNKRKDYGYKPAILGGLLLVITLAGFYSAGFGFKRVEWIQIYGYTIFDFAIGLIVYYVVTSEKENRLNQILELKCLKWIGVRSYSLYLWHLPLYPAFLVFSRSIMHSGLYVVISALVLGIGFTFAAGVTSYNLSEKRFTTRR